MYLRLCDNFNKITMNSIYFLIVKERENKMKKLAMALMMITLLLAGCGSGSKGPLFTEKMAMPFEIVKYEEKIAPVYASLVPHIAYATTEGQLEVLKARFQVDEFDINMDTHMALFVVVNSDSCGVAVNGVYDRDGMLSVQLLKPQNGKCDVDPVPHTFVIQVEKGDYERVQLYEDVVLKSTMEIKE